MTSEYDYWTNVYSEPDKFNLKIVKDFGDGGGYDWSTMVVWVDEFGNLFYAHDSGCSCNSPFEGVQSTNDLTPYEEGAFYKALMRWADEEGQSYCTLSDVIEGLQTVRRIGKEGTVKYEAPKEPTPETKILTEVVDRQWEYRIDGARPPNIDALDIFIVRYDMVAKTSQYATASSQGDVAWTPFNEGEQILPVIRIGGVQMTKLALQGEDEVKALVKKLKQIPA